MPGDGSQGLRALTAITNEPHRAAAGAYVRAVMAAAVLVNFDLVKQEDHPAYLITLLVSADNCPC